MKVKFKVKINFKHILILTGIIFALALVITAVVKLNEIVAEGNKMNLADKYLREGRSREASILYENIIKGDPKNIDGRIGLFKAYLAIGDKKMEESLLKDTIKVLPKEEVPYFYLSRFYEEENQSKEALTILKQCYSNMQTSSAKDLLERCTAQPDSIESILTDALTENLESKVVLLISAPVITFPANGLTYNRENIDVTWNSITGANNYFVAVRDITSGKKIVDDVNVKKNTSYLLSSALLNNDHKYCISVGAQYGDGEERWNENMVILISF